MIATAWLLLSGLMYSLQLSPGSFPQPLTRQEEQHYLHLAAQGDLEARNILIERNLRLVSHIMKKYYAASADQEDLISIGTIGLIKGISTFDPDKGARLGTYAARCVENAILSPSTLRKLIWEPCKRMRPLHVKQREAVKWRGHILLAGAFDPVDKRIQKCQLLLIGAA